MEYFLPILFFVIAFIYSSVGLGGASSYTAIMAIMGISYQIIPTTSLALNIVVTFFGTINYWRNGYGRLKLVGPFLITSIPMAYIAGSIDLNENIFQTILLLTLILVAVRIYFFDTFTFSFQLSQARKWIFIILLGSILGFIAGAIGIGGGIYLVPLIIMFGLGSEKEAAAAGTIIGTAVAAGDAPVAVAAAPAAFIDPPKVQSLPSLIKADITKLSRLLPAAAPSLLVLGA